ncbi:ATP-binding protein [Vibrio scophthalmi]|uniref:ATP-binding protein n=1 Tax=Vibrio scophthalmi TaxID=45658 RepID=UPI003873A2C7
MNSPKILTLLLSSIVAALFIVAYMSYQNSRHIENALTDVTMVGHELLGHRDTILNYQYQQQRRHFLITQRITEIEKLAKAMLKKNTTITWFPISSNVNKTSQKLVSFEKKLLYTSSMLDMLVGIQVARKYAYLSLESLFKQALNERNNLGLEWHFVDFMNQNLLDNNVAHPQIKQFAMQLRQIDERRTSLRTDLLNEHNYEFIEKTETALRQYSHSELNNALMYCLGAVTVLILMFSIQAYLRFTHLKALNKEMVAASEKALNAAKAKSQFLATMSHELRTPMNGVLGIAQIIAGETQENATKKNVGIILESGQHLMTVLNDILDFSKIEENKLELEAVHFHLNQILMPVVSAITPLAEEKNLTLEINNQIPDNIYFIGDSARLRQILFNLAGNAIKFTAKGKITIQAQLDNITPSHLILSVSDTGIGIPPHKHDAIFASFEQADASTTREFGGSGLGLAIVKKLTELMDGTITLMSRENVGSTFTITIPLPLGEKAIVANQDPVSASPLATRSLNILLAEDNRVNAIVAKGFCNKLGHHVDIAENGQIAIDKATKESYDLILMDNHMPEMNGIEATYYLRHVLDIKTLIFAYTADVFREAHDDFINAGADHVLTKPLQNESFYDAISNFSHRIQTQNTPELSGTNVIHLHREDVHDLRLTEEELSKSELLNEVKQDIDIYQSLLQSLIEDFETHIDELIIGFEAADTEQLGKTLHCLKGITLNLQLDNLANLTIEMEQQVRENKIPCIDNFQKLINRLSVNIHQGNRLIEKNIDAVIESNETAPANKGLMMKNNLSR